MYKRQTYVNVGKDGLVDPDDIRRALTDKTILVSVMLANNEVGSIQPIGEIGKITRERGVLLHSDAVQGIGKTEFDVRTMNVDLASLTAHKLYGPKGVGALYVRRSKPRVRLVAQMDGGGHERGNRSGTLNVPGIVGFAKACEILQQEGKAENERIRGLRDRLHAGVVKVLDEVVLNGHPERRLPCNLNLSFSFVDMSKPENIVACCRRHHEWIGDHPTEARLLGLHGFSGDELAELARRRSLAPER